MSRVAQFPRPQKCSVNGCENVFTGSVCNLCKEERPAFTALKRITAKAHHGVPALRDPQACKYFPKSICGCDGRYTCLESA